MLKRLLLRDERPGERCQTRPHWSTLAACPVFARSVAPSSIHVWPRAAATLVNGPETGSAQRGACQGGVRLGAVTDVRCTRPRTAPMRCSHMRARR